MKNLAIRPRIDHVEVALYSDRRNEQTQHRPIQYKRLPQKMRSTDVSSDGPSTPRVPTVSRLPESIVEKNILPVMLRNHSLFYFARASKSATEMCLDTIEAELASKDRHNTVGALAAFFSNTSFYYCASISEHAARITLAAAHLLASSFRDNFASPPPSAEEEESSLTHSTLPDVSTESISNRAYSFIGAISNQNFLSKGTSFLEAAEGELERRRLISSRLNSPSFLPPVATTRFALHARDENHAHAEYAVRFFLDHREVFGDTVESLVGQARCFAISRPSDHYYLDLFRQAQESGAQSLDFFQHQGRALYRANEFEEARQSFNKALELCPADPSSLLHLLYIAEQTNDLESIPPLAQTFLRARPFDSESNSWAGFAHSLSSNWHAAAEHYKKAILRRKDLPELYLALAHAYIKSFRLSLAQQAVNQAYSLPNASSEVRYQAQRATDRIAQIKGKEQAREESRLYKNHSLFPWMENLENYRISRNARNIKDRLFREIVSDNILPYLIDSGSLANFAMTSKWALELSVDCVRRQTKASAPALRARGIAEFWHGFDWAKVAQVSAAHRLQTNLLIQRLDKSILDGLYSSAKGSFSPKNFVVSGDDFSSPLKMCDGSLTHTIESVDQQNTRVLAARAIAYGRANPTLRRKLLNERHLHEDTSQADFAIGCLYELEKRYLEAEKYFENARTQNSKLAEAWLGRARCELSKGRPAAALPLAQRALLLAEEAKEAKGLQYEGNRVLGFIYQQEERWNKAQLYFTKADEIMHTQEIQRGLLKACLLQSKFEPAHHAWKCIKALIKKDDLDLEDEGFTALMMKQFQLAKEIFTTASQMTSAGIDSTVGLAQSLYFLKDFSSACDLAERALQRGETKTSLLRVGLQAAQAMNQPHRAMNFGLELTESRSSSADDHRLFAEVFKDLGDYQGAWTQLELARRKAA